MKIITCTLLDGFYTCGSSPDNNFWILSSFLTSDVGPDGASEFKDFLDDDKHSITCSNYSIIEKDGTNILLACQFDEDFEPCIRMTRQQFLSILDQWEELVKLRPKEIIIFKKGDSYILEGRNHH